MPADEMRSRFASARVARLATLQPDGSPHLVPVTFAVDGDALAFAVDAKPKTTQRLQRIRNIERDPRVSLLVDEYADDWSRLWGCASTIAAGGGRRRRALADTAASQVRAVSGVAA